MSTRTGPSNAPGALGGKNRSGESLTFQAIHQIVLPPVTVAAAESIDTVLTGFALPQETKILRIGVATLAHSGAAAVQVVMGTVAPTGTGNTMQVATKGIQVLALPATIPTAVGLTATVAAANMDVLYASGSFMSVRARSAAGNTATVSVTLDCVAVDEHPTSIQPFGPQSF